MSTSMPGATTHAGHTALRAAPSTGASQPSTARPTRPRPVPGACNNGRRSGRGSPAPSTRRDPALDQIAGELDELARHRVERGAFHLAQLDRENLQEVAVGVDGRRAAAIGRDSPGRDAT